MFTAMRNPNVHETLSIHAYPQTKEVSNGPRSGTLCGDNACEHAHTYCTVNGRRASKVEKFDPEGERKRSGGEIQRGTELQCSLSLSVDMTF